MRVYLIYFHSFISPTPPPPDICIATERRKAAEIKERGSSRRRGRSRSPRRSRSRRERDSRDHDRYGHYERYSPPPPLMRMRGLPPLDPYRLESR